MTGRAVPHEPVQEGECLSCHQKISDNHPNGSGAEFRLGAEGAQVCFDCHDDYSSFSHQHGPAASGACTYCHNPHGSDKRVMLRDELQVLCLECHTDFAESLQQALLVHSAVKELECDSCHVSHAGNHPGLLKDDTTQLCFDCHDQIGDKYKRSLNRHQAMYTDKTCANCHLSHFSEHRSLLIKDGPELCMGCHGQDSSKGSQGIRNIAREIKGKEFVHGPVAEGQCVDCHDPHGNSYSSLLRASFPATFYAPFEEDTYNFCFQCHDSAMLDSQRKSHETDFRNGSTNLHTVHVVMEHKGRTCRACHATHASDGAKLINKDGIPFGEWKIPIRFEPTQSGGSCYPGCHRGMGYDRQKPVDNSEKKVEEQVKTK